MANRNLVTYFPDRSIKQGYRALIKEMLSDVWHSRWLTYQLFKRNFSANYRQSAFGIFWVLIVPFFSIGTFMFLNSGGIFDVGDTKVPYPLFALTGTALWQLFSVGLTISANSLVAAGTMIKRLNFTRESLVFAAVGQGMVPPLLQAVIIFVLFAGYQISPPVTVLLVPFAMIPLFLLTLGLALVLSTLNAVVRDVGNGISVLMTFLLFLTPVLYAKPPSGIVASFSAYNPLYYLLSVPRDLFLLGSTEQLQGYMYSSLFSLAVFLVCWLAFRLAGTRMVERI